MMTIDGEQMHRAIYLNLRLAVKAHIRSFAEPTLAESLRPLGGYSSVLGVSRFADLIRSNHETHNQGSNPSRFGEIRDENGDLLDAELARLLQENISLFPSV